MKLSGLDQSRPLDQLWLLADHRLGLRGELTRKGDAALAFRFHAPLVGDGLLPDSFLSLPFGFLALQVCDDCEKCYHNERNGCADEKLSLKLARRLSARRDVFGL